MITRRFLHPYLKQISVIKRSQHIETAKSKSEHYQVLDVPPNATLTEIREAYYRKVKICHPDINPSEEAKRQFTIVQEAYKILSNVDRRIGYDRYLCLVLLQVPKGFCRSKFFEPAQKLDFISCLLKKFCAGTKDNFTACKSSFCLAQNVCDCHNV